MRLLVEGEDKIQGGRAEINSGGQTDVLRDGTFELRPAKPC